MISVIKSNGFDRIKSDLEEKTKMRQIVQNNVDSLENTLKILKTHNKQSGNENTKLIKENDRLLLTGDVIINF
jgi:hypothetical protein